MRCPVCRHTESRVIDSRPTPDGTSIRRRRECVSCGRRFTTYETIEYAPLMVIKKDGSRQPFDREKILCGLMNACKKLKLKIPDDISVIGFDNTLLSKYSDPKLTSVDQNTFQLGFNSAQLLLEKIGSKENYSKRIILSTELIERESVGYKKD